MPDGDGWHGVGTGFAAADGALAGASWQAGCLRSMPARCRMPRDVARLARCAFARGEAIAPERIEPAYLRNNVALTLAEQQALRASR